MNKVTQDVLAHLMPAVIVIIVFVSVVIGIPYLMVKIGFASRLLELSRAHPVLVGAILAISAIPLSYYAKRIGSEK